MARGQVSLSYLPKAQGQESKRISVRALYTLGKGNNQNLVKNSTCTGRTAAAWTYLVQLWVIEEVRPVWVSLHVPELKQLPQTKDQDVVTDLETQGEKEASQEGSKPYSHI